MSSWGLIWKKGFNHKIKNIPKNNINNSILPKIINRLIFKISGTFHSHQIQAKQNMNKPPSTSKVRLPFLALTPNKVE